VPRTHSRGAAAAGHEAPTVDGLRARLATRYELSRQNLLVAGIPFMMTGVRDTNVLLQRIDPAAFAREERLPFWAEIWASSLELSRWVLQGAVEAGTRVLELGCGVGLTGIAAARAGARVTMTDYEPDALSFAWLNAAENLGLARADERVRCAAFDWRRPYRGRRVPLVLGSDIMYDRALFEPLLQRLHECLTPEGRAVLADPDRSVGRDFLSLAEQSGFIVTSSAVPASQNGRTLTVIRSELRRRSHP